MLWLPDEGQQTLRRRVPNPLQADASERGTEDLDGDRDENLLSHVASPAPFFKVQVWTALIAILLLKYLQLRSRLAWSLSNLVALLRMNLFTHRDLWAWLDQPFTGPPTVLTAAQGVLDLA